MANTSLGLSSALLAAAPALLQGGCIEIYAGDKPLTANEAPPGLLLARVTRDGGAWTAGSPANGLQWVLANGFVVKPADHVWVIKGIATGEASWFRIKGNAVDNNDFSLAALRLDGTIQVDSYQGPESFDFYMPTLQITPATSRIINDFAFNLF